MFPYIRFEPIREGRGKYYAVVFVDTRKRDGEPDSRDHVLFEGHHLDDALKALRRASTALAREEWDKITVPALKK